MIFVIIIFLGIFLTYCFLLYYFIKIASQDTIDIDSESDLTTLNSGETPTLPGGEPVSIKALLTAQDNLEFELAYARLPTEHRLKVRGTKYCRYEPYKQKRSIKDAWY